MGQIVSKIAQTGNSKGPGLLVSITGKMTIETAQDFDKEISAHLTENTGTIFMNMAGMSYIDSSGVGVLIKLNNRAKILNTKIILFNLTDQVKKIFERAYLDRFFTIQTVESIRESFPELSI